MKKLIILFTSILLSACSSNSNDEKVDEPIANNNFIELNGTKYYFDTVKITKAEDASSVFFYVDVRNNTSTNRLFFALKILKSNSVPVDHYTDLIPTTYSWKASNAILTGTSLVKFNPDKTQDVIFTDSDFVIGATSRVNVIKNSENNYTFNINYITTLGNVTGRYGGEVTKVGF